MSLASRAAPNAASASAPRFASLSTRIGTSSRLRISATAATPTQPGRIALEPTTPSSWRIGPGSAMPAPITAPASMPASASSSTTSVGRRVEPSSAAWSVSSGTARSARIRERQVGHRDAQVVVPEVDADGGAGRGVEREQDRRPAALVAVRRGRLGRSITSPSAWRSDTRLETVERDRPVPRAISAQLEVPARAGSRSRAGGSAGATIPATRSSLRGRPSYIPESLCQDSGRTPGLPPC